VLAWSRPAPIPTATQTFIACKGPSTRPATVCRRSDPKPSRKRAPRSTRRAAPKFYDTVAVHGHEGPADHLLYHRNWLWRIAPGSTGLRTVPDGMVRVQGLQMK